MAADAPGMRLTVVQCDGATCGEVWPLQGRILGFALNTKRNATDSLTLTADNHDLSLFGHKALQHGTCLDVRWGYARRLSQPRRFYLEEISGFTELELKFSGRERPLHAEAKTRAWTNKRVSDVVREIARDNGFSGAFLHVADVDDSVDHVAQSAETDAALLQRLALSRGFEFHVDATGLHWHPPRKQETPVATLRYQDPDSGILQLTFSSNLARQAGRVEVRGRDPMRRADISAHANAATSRQTLGETIEVIDPERYATAQQKDNARTAIHPTPVGSLADAQREATARFWAGEARAIEARLVVVGRPELIARNIVRLDNVTPYLSGNYAIDEAIHTLNGEGYTTELRVTRDGGGARSGVSVAAQGGQRNTQKPSEKPEPVEVIDEDAYAHEASP